MTLLIKRTNSATGRSSDSWDLLRQATAETTVRFEDYVEAIKAAFEARTARPETRTTLPEVGTARLDDLEAVERAVASLATLVAPEELELGMDTPLIPALYHLIRTYGEGAVFELAASIGSSEIDPYIATWILRGLGRMSDDRTHRARRWLLERSLHSLVPMIRGAGAQGLASLRDRRALGPLASALERERYSRLRRDIQKAVRQIESLA